jgi:hypothetical protein
MMKNEFLTKLKELLSDLPQEEREEAVRYYEDYFEDAGSLEEARVLKELVSPEDVAEKIRAGYIGREKNCEEETLKDDPEKFERIPEDTGEEESETILKTEMEEGEPITQVRSGENPWVQGNADQEDARFRDGRMRMNEAYAQDYPPEDRYAKRTGRFRENSYRDEEYSHGAATRTKTYFSPVIFLLALLVGLPIVCPILLAIIFMMGGFFVGFGIGGMALIAGGVALLGNAFTFMSVGGGLVCLLSGGGLILAALGILFIVFAVNCAFRAIPALFRGIRNIVLSLRGRFA